MSSTTKGSRPCRSGWSKKACSPATWSDASQFGIFLIPTVTDARRRGWIVLPQDACKASDTPDSKPGYVRRLRVRGGWLHHTPWASWRILAGRALPESDQRGYNAWLRRLMADGTITPPDPAVLERMLRDAETRLQRAQSRDTRSNAAAAALAERAGRQVDGLREVKDGGNADALEARRAYLRAELDRLSGEIGRASCRERV